MKQFSYSTFLWLKSSSEKKTTKKTRKNNNKKQHVYDNLFVILMGFKQALLAI